MVFEADGSNSSASARPSSPMSMYTASAGYGLLDDVPPSYDSVASEVASQPVPSSHGEGSSRPVASAPLWPASMNAFFTGPPNVEPSISKDQVDAGPHIEVKNVFGKLETWDKKLSNPDVLYDFIRAQALNPPHIKVRCFARTHRVATVQTNVMENGHLRSVQAGQSYMQTDFDFTIDLTPVYSHENNLNNVHLTTVRPHVPAYRGTHSKTFGSAIPPNAYPGTRTTGRAASRNETDMWESWSRFCMERGRAPWAKMEDEEDFWLSYSQNRSRISLGSRPTLRSAAPDEEALLGNENADSHETPLKQWCEAYCADNGLLKSFVLRKVLWGWDMNNLRSAIERAILSTGYQPSGQGVVITFGTSNDDQITVRPNNWLVRMTRSTGWLILLWITLMYPIIWIWQRLSPRGGASYQVATATYAMKLYPPLPSTFPNETIEQARHRLPSLFKLHREVPKNPFLHRGPKGVHYLLGRREGEWFRSWEDVIRMGVRMGYQGELIKNVSDENEEPPELDGY